MIHTALEIETWTKISCDFTFNERSCYYGLEIDASKFYFYLKKQYGIPSVLYSSVSKFFPDRTFLSGKEWCYLFRTGSNFILVSGDDKINIAVFSIFEPPTSLDFEIFVQRFNEILKSFSLEDYKSIKYEMFINYSFYLRNIIIQLKNTVEKKLPQAPEELSMLIDDVNTDKPEIKYKYIELCNDYNTWLKAVLDKMQSSLQIQILMPIHFESLLNLAFRIKLKKEFRNYNKIYGDSKYPVDIYEDFERLSIPKKVKRIESCCFEVNHEKISRFLKNVENTYNLRQRRNNFLHGNALYFRNSNINYYVDDNYLIGFPDRSRAIKSIINSISVSSENKKLLETIRSYEELCVEFTNIFNDNDYFKSLIDGIAFAHNSKFGGVISIGMYKYDDLFAPTEWE